MPAPKIEVTNEVIHSSCQRNARHCMIAQAIRQRFPKAVNISVDLQTIRWSDPEKRLRYTYLTPPRAQNELVRFDMGTEGIKPFSFQLRGGQATSMVVAKKRAHKLGQRSQTVTKSGPGQSVVAQTVGGKPPPLGTPRHASHNTLRTFGLRGFTAGFVEIQK
jgi:hypothetical protein